MSNEGLERATELLAERRRACGEVVAQENVQRGEPGGARERAVNECP